jgi:hypothetical protein
MWRLILITVFFAGTVMSAPVRMNAGALSCGIQQLSSNQVQTYCYLGSALYHNQIASLPLIKGSVILGYNYCRVVDTTTDACKVIDIVTWKFTLRDGKMNWEYTTNGSAITKGIF